MDQTNTTVSVVIPAYNAATTIVRSINSVLNQTIPVTEIIVVDDGSPDGDDLKQVLMPFDNRVKLVRKDNGGAASARNFGIGLASGEWVAFLDADDYWEPEKIATQVSTADSFGVNFVACRWWSEVIGQPKKMSGSGRYCGKVLRLSGLEAWSAAMSVWTGGVMIRRERLGVDPFVPGLEPAEDKDLWFRLISENPAFILPDFLATYVQYSNSLSNSDPDRDCSSMLKVVRKHSDLLGPSGVRREEADVYRRWSSLYLTNRQYGIALKYASKRLSICPLSTQAWYVVAKLLWLRWRGA